ncbi:response regulator [Flavobacterium sp. Sd200]|uniref:response regulator n=1 Tax=Flavobacterium sp. Sd200 TaxID=2692211 RepID=UPI00136B4C0E|nr:response regulator [Flavobacterium sp. Sd200]MXN93235.1 response regulator [Flavobacterium sp. Sd200]
MKVAIFENEYESVRIAFETANLIEFNNNIEFIVFASSQSANTIDINQFDVIFIDIDLSVKSILDGYSLIKNLIENNSEISKKIVVLTGNNKIREAFATKGIDSNTFQLIIKPTDFIQIANSINKVIGQQV